MRYSRLISAAVLTGAVGLSIAACDPVSFNTADGGHGSLSCPSAPTAAPASAVSGTCTWNFTPGSSPSDTPTTTPSTTTTDPTTTPTTTTTTTTADPTTTTKPPTSPPPAGQFPNPGNTGVPAGTALTTRSGDLRLGAGATLKDAHVTGSVYIEGSGVVITDSEIDGGINNISAPDNSFTVSDTTIGPASGCKDAGPEAGLEAGNFTATRVLIRNYNHSVQPEAPNAVVSDSFMKVCANPGDHADGVIAYQSGPNVRIIHNTIDMTGVPAADQTAPVFDTGRVSSFDIENNLLLGGSYSVRIYDDGPTGSGYVVKGNSVADGSWLYGAVDSDCSAVAPWSSGNANGNQLVKVDSDYAVTSVVGPLFCTQTR
jgi:hypothetical protein